MRIGFAVKVLGDGGLKECDMRRWQNSPHLKCSIEMLRELFHYLDRNNLRMYRMSSDMAPYLTHPDLPQFHNQLEEAKQALSELRERDGMSVNDVELLRSELQSVLVRLEQS